MNELNFSIHNTNNPYQENKLELMNNTPDEIKCSYRNGK